MAVQVRADNINNAFIQGGDAQSIGNAIFEQDAGRVAPLVFGTVVSKIAGNSKYVPYTDVAAIDGSGTPVGIYIGADIPAADLVAGDVANRIVLVGSGVRVDSSQVVLENALELITPITAVPWASTATIRDVLHLNGIDLQDTVDISGFENS